MQPPTMTSPRARILVTMTMFCSWVVTVVLQQFSRVRLVMLNLYKIQYQVKLLRTNIK